VRVTQQQQEPQPQPQPLPVAYASADPQFAIDAGHIRTLAICHYIWGGLITLISCIFIFHIVMGAAIISGALNSAQNPPPPQAGWFFVGLGSCALMLGWAIGILNILSGRWMTQRRRRVFSLVMAGINCASFPFGTALGVFTFLVLLRPSVRASFEHHA
jgi:hypothetical protein